MLKYQVGLTAFALGATVLSLSAITAKADVVLTIGAGSAVKSVEASADFESPAANSGLYSENGFSFLDPQNASHPNHSDGQFPSFSGNYIYVVSGGGGASSFEEMRVNFGSPLHELEMIISGWRPDGSYTFEWQASNGIQGFVGSGSVALNGSTGTVVGFKTVNGYFPSSMGFDTLDFIAHDQRNQDYAIAFDSVRGQFTEAVPESSTWAMMILGFFGLGFLASRRQNRPALSAA